MPKILYIVRDDGGCGHFRCFQPAKFLKRMGLANAEAVLRTPTDEQLRSADLVIMQEMGSQNAVEIFEKLRLWRIPFMAEFDDFVHHVSPRNIWGFPAWNPSTLYIHRAMELARASAGVTVSTPQLAREYFPYNPFIYVIPNYLDKDLWDVPVHKFSDGKIRIGWMGGNAHSDDLKMVSGVLEKILKQYDGKVMFETMGMTHQELGGIFSLNAQATECSACGYQGMLKHSNGEPINEYPMALAGKGWDIAIAPVINNSFGNCKSDLKIKEYSAIGLPIVASDIVPYKEAVDNGASVLLANSFESWYNMLVELIENKEKREEMGRKNKQWAKGNWIQDNTLKIFEVYAQVLARVARTRRSVV